MAFTTSGLMEGATSPAAAKFMEAVSALHLLIPGLWHS